MRKIIPFAAGILAITLCPAFPAQSQDGQTIKRFVLAVGANHGGAGRTSLYYAVSDAQSFLKVIQEMGGVSEEDAVFLNDPDQMTFFKALDQLQSKIGQSRAVHKRVEVILYYSGHSDQSNILLKKDRIPYLDFRKKIDDMNADVRIAILDSCASGAFTRVKGGKKTAPFLFDSAFNMSGYAFITSSSADEASQESDALQASFFTHHLISGLRGGADLNQDGKVTLNEAYQYAFNETLVQTQNTQGGPQHPNYDIQMTGTGDVVMTDLSKSPVILAFGKDVSGRIFIHDSRDKFVAELNKPAERVMEIGLEAGKYRITNVRGDESFSSDVVLEEGKPVEITSQQLVPQARIPTRARGDETKPEPDEGRRDLRTVPFQFDFFATPDKSDPTRCRFNLFIINSYLTELDGFSSGPGVSIVTDDMSGFQISAVANLVGGTVSKGAQVTAGVNIAGKDLYGWQVSALANIVKNRVEGGQVSAGLNWAQSLKGPQISAMANLVKEDFKGAQISGALNYARNADGAQVGVFNYAKSVRGVQVGVFNFSGKIEQGGQFGVFNIAGESDQYSFGLFNFIGKGTTRFVLWTDELGFVSAGVKHGTKKFYNIWSAGSNPSFRQGFLSWGYGVTLKRFESVTLSVDGLAKSVFREGKLLWFSSSPGLLASLRFVVDLKLAQRTGLVAGLSFNYFNPFDDDQLTIPKPFHKDLFDWDEHRIKHWVGFFVGIQL